MLMNVLNIIFFIMLLLCILLYGVLTRYKRFYSNIILAYLFLILSVSVVAMLMMKAGISNNLFLFHIYTPIEYSLLSLLYANVLLTPLAKKIILYSIPVFITLSILSALFVQHIDENNSMITILESLLVLGWSLFFLREVLLLQQVTDLQQFPMFWICVGILFYFTGSLITEGMMNYLIRHSIPLAQRIYSFSYIFKYVLFTLLLIGAFCALTTRNRRSLDESH